jgi:hypothetical protein
LFENYRNLKIVLVHHHRPEFHAHHLLEDLVHHHPVAAHILLVLRLVVNFLVLPHPLEVLVLHHPLEVHSLRHHLAAALVLHPLLHPLLEDGINIKTFILFKENY